MGAEKGNDYAKGNKGGGRKTSYQPEFANQALVACKLGATDKDLATLFSVSETTINTWKDIHEEFSLALKRGKLDADIKVAESLYKRALGYSHPDSHISNFKGEITVTDTTKHYPPDTTAAIFWLKNRQPDKWRDKQEMSVDAKTISKIEIEEVIDYSKLSPETLEELASFSKWKTKEE